MIRSARKNFLKFVYWHGRTHKIEVCDDLNIRFVITSILHILCEVSIGGFSIVPSTSGALLGDIINIENCV